MTNKNEDKILDSIVDVNYENHFNKEFEGKTVESNKNTSKAMDEIFLDFSDGINQVISSVKKGFNDMNVRRKLNFTILTYDELLDLQTQYNRYARKVGISIGLIIASVGFFPLTFYAWVFLAIGIAFICLGILIIVKQSLSFNNQYGNLTNKNIQLTENDYAYLIKLANQHKYKNVNAIMGLMISIFAPLIMLIAALVITQASVLMVLLPILFIFFVSLGIGVGNIIHYGLMTTFYTQIKEGKPFRQ